MECSSDDLVIFRLFKHGHTRTLLRLELEITEIEERLFELELSFVNDPNNKHQLTSTTFKEGENEEYKDSLQKLKEKIKEYGEGWHYLGRSEDELTLMVGDIALNYAQLHALGRPQERNHRCLFNYIVAKRPLAAENRKYVYMKDDFIRIANCRTNYFEESVQHYFGGNQNSIFKVSDPRMTREAEENAELSYVKVVLRNRERSSFEYRPSDQVLLVLPSPKHHQDILSMCSRWGPACSGLFIIPRAYGSGPDGADGIYVPGALRRYHDLSDRGEVGFHLCRNSHVGLPLPNP